MKRAEQFGLQVNPGAVVTVLPSVSGYVGADITAGIASTDMPEQEKQSLFIDIGTNGEMALGNRDALVCCSTAAGPAFEGARIFCGIGGGEGAINHYRNKTCTTIGGKPAVGICGSGLIDVVASLLRDGAIDASGFLDHDVVIVGGEHTAGGRDIVLTPADVREVQLAKAAIRAGIEILLKEAGVDYTGVGRVYLAGAFGNYLDMGSAVAIGLLPPQLEKKVAPVGNSAGTGARLALRSVAFEAQVGEVARKARYIELSMRQDFNDAYVNAMMFI